MIYLDNNATTRPLPSVVEIMRDALDRFYGNPSSQHPLGFESRRLLEQARESAGEVLNAKHASQIVFTAGGTESINLAFSILLVPEVRQILISAVEHHAVLTAAQRWAAGRSVREIPVDTNGILDLDYLESALKSGVAFVSLQLANNETGVLFDTIAAAQLCQKYRAFLHVDAIQVPGRASLDLDALNCDAVSLSAHKFHGPKGSGLLFLRNSNGRSLSIVPGHQEFGVRGGTENLPAILGAAEALRSIKVALSEETRLRKLRDSMEAALLEAITGSAVNGRNAERLPQTSNFFFPDRSAADLVMRLGHRGVCVSAGAACSTGGTPSHVLKAMALGEERANGSLRLSFSRFTTEEEVTSAIQIILETYQSTLPLLHTQHPIHRS